jgi:ankyrin repeat protein
MAARAELQYGPGPSNRTSQHNDPYAAQGSAPNTMRVENIHASGSSRQHIGDHFQSTTNNYTAAPPYGGMLVKPPEDPIHYEFERACHEGQAPQRLGFLLSRGANLDHRDKEQWTPLHHAAAGGSVPTISFLVDAGADIHACRGRSGTPLHHAASSKSVDAVRYLLNAGADVHGYSRWVRPIGTPLHYAAFAGSADAARCLLDSGADANAFGEWVGTPLIIAAARGHLAVVELLLECGVYVNQDCEHFGSPAHMACAGGNMEVLQLLYRSGASPFASATTCYAIYSGILGSIGGLFPRSLGLRTLAKEIVTRGPPVILAVSHGHLAVAEYNLDMDPGVGRYRNTAYQESSYPEEEWQVRYSTWFPLTNLAIATLDVEMLQLLLNKGINPAAFEEDGRPPMFRLGTSEIREAAYNGKNASTCISLLLQHGVSNSCLETERLGRIALSGDTLLISIVRREFDFHHDLSCDIAEAVVKHGASVDALNDLGQTAIMIAAGNDHTSRARCVELLCKNGANVDLKDKDGRTALDYARRHRRSHGSAQVELILQQASGLERPVCQIM